MCTRLTVIRRRKMQTETLQPTEAKQYAISQNHQYCPSQHLEYIARD